MWPISVQSSVYLRIVCQRLHVQPSYVVTLYVLWCEWYNAMDVQATGMLASQIAPHS